MIVISGALLSEDSQVPIYDVINVPFPSTQTDILVTYEVVLLYQPTCNIYAYPTHY